MNQPKLSVVLPIYNVEKYLKTCLDCLLSQTLTEFEIIAVNDGSTDKSVNTLEEYSRIDSRIKVINKKNGGLGDARNAGLKHVTGKYVMFVDPDDWLESGALNLMFITAEKNELDVLVTPFILESLSGSNVMEIHVEKNKIFESKRIKEELIRRLIGVLPNENNHLDELNSAANKMYRTEMIKKNNLSFVSERAFYGEDLVFNLNFFQFANRIMILDKALYHYRKDVSTSLTTRYRDNLYEMRLNLYNYISEYVQKYNTEHNEKYNVALQGRIYYETPSTIRNECHYSNLSSQIDVIKKIKKILLNSHVKFALQEYKPSYKLNRFKKLQYASMKSSYVLPTYLFYKLKFLSDRTKKK